MRTLVIAVLAAFAAIVSISPAAAQDFSWHAQIGAGQTLEILGVNGDIRAISSSSGDAEVTATKSARRSNPAEVRVQVVPHAGGVTICAVYPDVPGQEPNRCEPGERRHMHTRDNDTVVRFEVRVPVGVRFVGRTVNGGVEGESLDGDAEGHTVNGSVKLATSGVAVATTVNGSLNLTMGRADWPGGAKLSTVNGSITLNLPTATSADLEASTMNGEIRSDFPITVTGEMSRRRLRGTIGGGGQELALSTVNGSIKLLRQQ